MVDTCGADCGHKDYNLTVPLCPHTKEFVDIKQIGHWASKLAKKANKKYNKEIEQFKHAVLQVNQRSEVLPENDRKKRNRFKILTDNLGRNLHDVVVDGEALRLPYGKEEGKDYEYEFWPS